MNIEKLKALAEKATPGPWMWDSDPIKGDPLDRTRFRVVATGRTITQCYYSSGDEMAQTEAAYIAAASPAAVLELIAQLEDAQSENRALLATEQNLRERVKELEEGLGQIRDIKLQEFGADWEEIEEAQGIARALLEQQK